jgi:acetylornithine deacetylase/succinyl-diaminopimelate desuccinylase-like protein
VFAAVAQEETGLQGMKKLFDDYKDQAVAFVDILGDGRSISYGAIGIHWYKIIANGPPGHSLGGGTPNVNQGIGRAIDRILSLPITEPMREAQTIVNVGKIESGNVFNHKPEEGWFSLDIRSLEAGIIADIEAKVDEILLQTGEETGTKLRKEAFQLTPGGQIPDFINSELVMLSQSISRMMNLEPRMSNRGSSNMNVPLGVGVPAIGLGGERGGRRGFEDEWADIDAMLRSAIHVMLMAALYGS